MSVNLNNTYRIIESYAQLNPHSTAIAAPGRGLITYSELLQHAREFFSALRVLGIRQQDRVAIVLPNGPEMAVTLFSVSAFATSAPLNPIYQQSEFESYFTELNIKLLITKTGFKTAARSAAFIYDIPVFEVLDECRQGPGFEHLVPKRYLQQNEEVKSISSMQGSDVALVLLTSGTTSKPKIVPLTHQNIGTAVQYICSAIQLGPDDRCLSMMPQFHIGGLVDLLLAPLASGGSVISTSGFDVNNFFDILRQYQPTWYQSVPATLFELVSEAERNRDPVKDISLRFIRAVSAPLPMQTLDRVEDYFGVPVIEVYGMTEASPIIATNPLPPGKRKRHSVGVSAGPEISILDEDGSTLTAGKTGEVVIRGDNVISGYENNAEVNSNVFNHGWFHTGDSGYLDDEGYLFLTGRVNEIINRGGEKISPYEIDTVLMEHPAIAQAITFPVSHIILGEDIAAAVVLENGNLVEEEELLNFLSTRLADFKIPQRIFFIDEIPRGDTGKYQRKGLAEKLDLNVSATYMVPETKLEMRLAKIWCDILSVDQVGRDDNFFSLGGYSLLAMRLVTEVEKETGKPFPLDALTQSITLKKLAQAIEEVTIDSSVAQTILNQPSPLTENLSAYKMMQSVVVGGKFPLIKQGSLLTQHNCEELHDIDSNNVKLTVNNAKQPFFWCFNAPDREMTALAEQLGTEQPIYGMFAGARVLRDIEIVNTAIAKHYAEELSLLFPDMAFNLGGNCRGANIASQTAFYLIEKGHTVNRLCSMEYFHPRLFNLPGKMLLLFGQESHVTDYEKFNWQQNGWEDKFSVIPEVAWTPGRHGEFFINPNIGPLSVRISQFFSD